MSLELFGLRLSDFGARKKEHVFLLIPSGKLT
jgi:hypothetical protein